MSCSNLDIGWGALRDSGGQQGEEVVDVVAGAGLRIRAEERRRQRGLRDGEIGRCHGRGDEGDKGDTGEKRPNQISVISHVAVQLGCLELADHLRIAAKFGSLKLGASYELCLDVKFSFYAQCGRIIHRDQTVPALAWSGDRPVRTQ